MCLSLWERLAAKMADAEAAARAGLQAKSAARKAKKDKTKAMAAMLGLLLSDFTWFQRLDAFGHGRS
jgi:hypothetical protein